MRPDAEPTRLLLRALAVGLIAGAAAALLRWAATEAPHLLWPGPDLVQGVALATPLRRVAVPALGGLVAGVVLIGLFWHFQFHAHGFDQDTWLRAELVR